MESIIMMRLENNEVTDFNAHYYTQLLLAASQPAE